MPTLVSYPETIVQEINDNATRGFNNIKNIKNGSASYAETGKLLSPNQTKHRIAKLICTNFKFNVPLGAKINSIKVEYAHQKIADTKDKYPSIAGPTIILNNSGIKPLEYVTWVGPSPTKSMTQRAAVFKGVYSSTKSEPTSVNVSNKSYTNITHTYQLPSRNIINSSNFGVVIRYPSNTSNNYGYLRIQYIRIVINYTLSSYSLVCRDMYSTEQHIVLDSCWLEVTLSNIILSDYNTSVRITLPENCVFNRGNASNGGSLVQKDENTILWNTNSRSNGNVNCNINLKFKTPGTHTITITELLNNTTKTFDFIILPTPTGFTDESNSELISIYAKQNTDFSVPIKIPPNMLTELQNIKITCDNSIRFNNNPLDTSIDIPVSDFNDNGEYMLTCNIGVTGLSYLYFSTDSSMGTPNYVLKIIPSNFSYPNCSILTLNEEELNRMGNGYEYTIESFLKIICAVENENLFNDYYKNFRIGVFNDSIPENTDVTEEYLIDHTVNWSSAISVFNEWEEKTVSFEYDNENPLYILITGDYMNNHPDECRIVFTDICIIEDFNEYESPGNFLIPINETLLSSSEISLNTLSHSNSVVIYDFPFNEDFGTNDNIAIRGIEFICNVDSDSDCVLKAKLKSSHGKTGERSIVINSDDKEISLGGVFDLWGFNISEMINLKDWSIELQLQNLLNTDVKTVDISISDIKIIVYFLPLKINRVFCIVDGENMRHRGMFLKSVKLLPGLKTKTRYITVEGSDFNEPGSMNITQKEIEIEFSVRGCTIEETTELLRDIAKFMTNDRDELNNAIPKRIEFSHIPGYHFDYILEDPIDEDPKTIGYESKMKLTIYDGTSWANEDTVTNTSGANEGISKVQPVIECVPLSTSIEINEITHDQKFTIANDDFNSSSIVRIDCANQKVEFKDNIDNEEWEDITYLADWDVDWFVLYPGEFLFEGNGTCLIQNVIHTRRGA